jgi:hypothetical protein
MPILDDMGIVPFSTAVTAGSALVDKVGHRERWNDAILRCLLLSRCRLLLRCVRVGLTVSS